MKPGISNDKIETLYQNVKLTEEEINQNGIFQNLVQEDREGLIDTIFNLSVLLLKMDKNESA